MISSKTCRERPSFKQPNTSYITLRSHIQEPLITCDICCLLNVWTDMHVYNAETAYVSTRQTTASDRPRRATSPLQSPRQERLGCQFKSILVDPCGMMNELTSRTTSRLKHSSRFSCRFLLHVDIPDVQPTVRWSVTLLIALAHYRTRSALEWWTLAEKRKANHIFIRSTTHF